MSSAHETQADDGNPGIEADRRTRQAHRATRDITTVLRVRRRTALVTGAVVVVLVAEVVMVAPHAHQAAGHLAHARLRWIPPALACEMVSMMTFARLQRHALGVGGLRVRLGSVAATVFAGNAVGATLPGGSLASITYRTRRMRSWGASAPQIGFTHAATGILSTIALALIAGVGHVLAGDSSQLRPVAVHVGVICALTSGALALVHHPAVLRRPVRAVHRLVRRLRRGALDQTSADRLLDELAAMQPPARFWARGLVLALLNWSGDFVCLLAACHAVGASPALSTALFAYIAGMTAASAMPLLPAGIGTLDAALVLTLHHGGVPATIAMAADLLFRTITPGLVTVAGSALLIRQRRQAAHAKSVRSGCHDDRPCPHPSLRA
ncbi:YbhN family protein [Peterkaempfera sp. SMS 1(5)a]|uniref:lysylphosphatidylglycerol synthase transmembrane domain-containing protein n=1 Tax=Peterkaempfera podocarpi TaxID=3232308 RepID=UPI0036736391